jgi:hypothetical protein
VGDFPPLPGASFDLFDTHSTSCTSGPVHYRFGKTVTYVTRSGRVLDEDTVRTRVRVGVPVRVHYVGTAPDMVVDRVILEED